MNDFVSFLIHSPTPWHAADRLISMLKGFEELDETKDWNLKPGSYWVRRSGALIAFRLPARPTRSLLIASHLDSPGLKLKPRPDLTQHGSHQFGVEVYGGPLLYTWFDRDLCISGQVATNQGLKLVHLDSHPLLIPSLAIHLDREINDKGFLPNKQSHLKPLAPGPLKKILGFEPLAFDLFLTPLEAPRIYGDLISGYRLDNLSSAYASCLALVHGQQRPDTLQMAVFFDHEEIGSETGSGALSPFVDEVLERLVGRNALLPLKRRSLALSVDVGHALHPNYPDKSDLENSSKLGAGPAIKCNAMRRYATSAATAAPLLALAGEKKISLQLNAGRSDLTSGSTVGPLMEARLGIPTVDLGVPLLGMHSIRETISMSDLDSLTSLLTLSLGHL
jgi:aspartyl aminopeptidase